MDTERIQAIEKDGYIREEACSSEVVSLYPVKKVYWATKTPFAEAVLAECPGFGKTLFLDNEIQSAQSDEYVYHECLVHPVMASVPSDKRDSVLIIGGGEGATLREVLKWRDVKRVVWIDIDGDLVNACRQLLGWASEDVYTDPRVTYKAMDIRAFFRENTDRFDVILIDLPDPDVKESLDDPDCLQNREFWTHVRGCLADGGAFATHCGPLGRGPQLNGLTWVSKAALDAGFSKSFLWYGHYHAVIPSFQADWAFKMSCPPRFVEYEFPFYVRFMTPKTFRYVFSWPE